MKYTTPGKYSKLSEEDKSNYGIYSRCPSCNCKVFKSYNNWIQEPRCRRCTWHHTYPYSKEPLDAVNNYEEILKIAPLCINRQKIRFICPQCSKETTVHANLFNRNTLCRACSIKNAHLNLPEEQVLEALEKRKKTCIKKYGVENVFQNEEIKNKIKETCLERYGVENPLHLEEFKEKAKQTSLERYGVEYAGQSEKIKNKIKETCLEKYGVEYASQALEVKDKIKRNNLKKYGVEYHTQLEEVKDKIKKTSLERYGSEQYLASEDCKQKTKKYFLENYGVTWSSQVPEIKEKYKQTCLKRYHKEYYLQTEDARIKTKQTCLEKYGYTAASKSPVVKEKAQQTCLEKYGEKCYSQTLEFNKKCRKIFIYKGDKFDSSWELYYWIWALENNHEITRHPRKIEYIFNNELHYYFPDFEIDGQLVEIKGSHFFDENGKMINPYDRSMDNVFEAKHQCGLQYGVKFITDISEAREYVDSKYTSDFVNLFRTNIEFPYPNNNLTVTSDRGLIQYFHKSIWDARVRNNFSPKEAWQDKELVYKIAINRLKYVGSCKPTDILHGFSVTKKAPKVSVFKPTLAKRIIETYASEYDTIFDPFSGFSGRMLGAIRNNKNYVGQDLSETHIEESRQLMEWVKENQGLDVEVVLKCQDILTDECQTFESTCLFTCSPYGAKETWTKGEVQLSCDEWIDVCLEKYKCDRYIFVVDETEKYKDHIIETIENKSHFGTNNEYIILL